jgi:arabinogalactan oligomer / maltooligosaccharide transport system substrate-binding protein
MLSAWSENEYWATELMKFMVSDEMNMHYYEVAGEMPAQDHLLQEEVIADDALMAGFAEQATRGEPMPNIPEMTPVWEPMGDALQFIADGDDVEEVLQEAVQQIEEQISIMGN